MTPVTRSAATIAAEIVQDCIRGAGDGSMSPSRAYGTCLHCEAPEGATCVDLDGKPVGVHAIRSAFSRPVTPPKPRPVSDDVYTYEQRAHDWRLANPGVRS